MRKDNNGNLSPLSRFGASKRGIARSRERLAHFPLPPVAPALSGRGGGGEAGSTSRV
jgi:hypothetical protein